MSFTHAISEVSISEGFGAPADPSIPPDQLPVRGVILGCPALEEFVSNHNFRLDATLDLDRMINQVLQPTLDILCAEATRWTDQQDLETANSQTIDAMLRDLGNPFRTAFDQPLNRRRLLVRVLIDVYKAKGTAPGLGDVIRALTGLDIVRIISPATIDAWDLGVDVIGDDINDPPILDEGFTDLAIFGPDPGFMRYSFQIEMDRVLTDDEREVLTEIVQLVKPAHTHFMGFVEPLIGVTVDHWELGASFLHDAGEPLLGDETDLHGP